MVVKGAVVRVNIRGNHTLAAAVKVALECKNSVGQSAITIL